MQSHFYGVEGVFDRFADDAGYGAEGYVFQGFGTFGTGGCRRSLRCGREAIVGSGECRYFSSGGVGHRVREVSVRRCSGDAVEGDSDGRSKRNRTALWCYRVGISRLLEWLAE